MFASTESPCCPKSAWPSLAKPSDYKSEGEEVQLAGTSCYISGAPEWGTAIIVMHDVFGASSGNHQRVCDELARGGHYVVMPDFFEGGSIEPFYTSGKVPDGKTWLRQFNWKWCEEKLRPIHEHLAEKGVKRVGSIGFCWGAWAVAKVCQDPSKVQAGVWAHPSCQVGKELYEGETENELASAVRSPTLILASPQEPAFYSNGELAKCMADNGVAQDCVYFADQSHGWVTRAAGFLGRSWEESGGTAGLQAEVGMRRAVNLALGWYAKHLWQWD